MSREGSSASPVGPTNMGDGYRGEYSRSTPQSTDLGVEEQAPTVDRVTRSTNTTMNANTTGEQEGGNEGGVEFQKPKRQKISRVWLEFTEVTLPNGTKKVECNHCKMKMAFITSGATSQYGRHLKTCPRRKVVEDNQHVLNFQPGRSSVDESMRLSRVAPHSKYDQGRMREAMAHWLLMHEHPFTIVEGEGFNFMMKIANPLFKKISRASLKKDSTSYCYIYSC